MKINFSMAPWDQASVRAAWQANGCTGVGAHFAANPIQAGDCIRIGDGFFRISAVMVSCEGADVYYDGTASGPVDHVHRYEDPNVAVRLWLVEISEAEYAAC